MCPEGRLFESVLNRIKVFDGKYLQVDRLIVSLPDGRRVERETVTVRDSVAVLPMEADRFVHLVRQHRPAIGKTILEVPAGLIDPGESKEEAAVRECEEETGYRPGALRELITYAHAEGYSTGFMTLFLGTNLKQIGHVRPDPNEFIESVTMPFDELLGLVHSNQIFDSKTILCVLLSGKILCAE